MSYVALYRKYRPANFKNVVGQETILKVLINSIKTNHISHAYLFTGPRGTGKTSIAKIFAKAVNCLCFEEDICEKCEICNALKENDTDIVEIDAASNNGVDEIRTLRDNIKLMPSFCKYKIYIIDEVHMLSSGAFNALLKTLEEPPSHVIFILATTEPNKIPLTILSRCQRFDFNKVDSFKVFERLKYILNNENVKINDDIIEYIAEITDGCLRDAVNLLDQTISLNKNEKTTLEDIDKLSGKIKKEIIFQLLNAIKDEKFDKLLEITNNLSKEGKNLIDVAEKMLIILRDISIYNKIKNYFTEEYTKELKIYSNFEDTLLLKLSQSLNEMINEMKYSNNQQILFEIYLMSFSQLINNEKNYLSIKENQNKEKIKKVELINSAIKGTDNNVEDEKENDNNKKTFNLNEIKRIRINNALATASKDELTSINKNYDRINDYFSNKKYNTIVELLNNAKVVAAGEKYLIFSFNEASNVSIFDNNTRPIELFLEEIYKKQYKIVAISEKEWLKTKEEYIFNKKNKVSYVLLDENVVQLKKQINSNVKKSEEFENSATDIFGSGIVNVK